MTPSANIIVKRDSDDPGVYLYTQYQGGELPQHLQDALMLKEQWNDAPSLARIIFYEMVRGYERGTTGFGISAAKIHDEDDVIIVSMSEQKVLVGLMSWTFQEFLRLRGEELDTVGG